jgi:hypothetical protein
MTQVRRINLKEIGLEMIETGMKPGSAFYFMQQTKWLYDKFGVKDVMNSKKDIIKYAIDNLCIMPFIKAKGGLKNFDIKEALEYNWKQHKNAYNYYVFIHTMVCMLKEDY